jgi:hypothetical protein
MTFFGISALLKGNYFLNRPCKWFTERTGGFQGAAASGQKPTGCHVSAGDHLDLLNRIVLELFVKKKLKKKKFSIHESSVQQAVCAQFETENNSD